MKAWRSKFHGGMGFRELEKFNLACLAKQSWRLLHNPYALWAKVIKGLHFPRTSFWQALNDTITLGSGVVSWQEERF